MNHLTEDQLVLHYYGETRTSDADAHLDSCDDCRAQYRMLQRVLNVVDTYPVPERDAGYGVRVWKQLQHHLPLRSRVPRNWFASHFQWVAAAAVAVLLIGAFAAGRLSRHTTTPILVGDATLSSGFDQRVLLSAVGNHLDRSQIILVELANSGKESDMESQREDIRDLIESNRLYRSSASQAGERAVTDVLDELERLLLEVAHLAPSLTPAQMEELRQRILGEGILFKLRVVGSEVREREKQTL